MNEEKLIQAAQKLGARAAERLDVDATARKVVERLREQPVRSVMWVQATWFRIAAALVLIVGGGLVMVRVVKNTQHPTANTHLIADDLRDLSTDDLRSLLTSFDQVINESVVPDSTADLPELDAQQLRQLLREG